KDGSRIWVNGTLAVIRDQEQKVQGFARITRDLTTKRRNDELLRAVLDNTLDAIVCTDERGTVSMVNRAAENVFGRAESAMVRQNIGVLIPDLGAGGTHLADFLPNGAAKITGMGREARGIRKDGSTFPVDLAVT